MMDHHRHSSLHSRVVSDVTAGSSLSTNPKFYTELPDNFVLLGRGTGPQEFEGNIRYREMVADVAMSTVPVDLLANKTYYARKIVDMVAKIGGRFVRKLSKGEISALQKSSSNFSEAYSAVLGNDIYAEVPHAVAIEKAKQSFRHHQRVQERNEALALKNHDPKALSTSPRSDSPPLKKRKHTAPKFVSRQESPMPDCGTKSNKKRSSSTGAASTVSSQIVITREYKQVNHPSADFPSSMSINKSSAQMVEWPDLNAGIDLNSLRTLELANLRRHVLAGSFLRAGCVARELNLLSLQQPSRRQTSHPLLMSSSLLPAVSAGFLGDGGAEAAYSSFYLNRLGGGSGPGSSCIAGCPIPSPITGPTTSTSTALIQKSLLESSYSNNSAGEGHTITTAKNHRFAAVDSSLGRIESSPPQRLDAVAASIPLSSNISTTSHNNNNPSRTVVGSNAVVAVAAATRRAELLKYLMYGPRAGCSYVHPNEL